MWPFGFRANASFAECRVLPFTVAMAAVNHRDRRMRTVNPLAKYTVVGVALLIGLYLLLPSSQHSDGLFMYCAAGVRVPIEQIREEYEQRYGVAVQIQYGGSNTLLSQLQVANQGDLFLAADQSYLELAHDKALVREVIPIAQMKPVVIVAKGNPKGIYSLDQLFELRVALANPDQAAIGRETRVLLQAAGRWQAMDAAVQQRGVYKPTVGEVANDVQVGAVDAGIVWDAVANQTSNVDIVHLDELESGRARIAIGVLSCCKQPAEALRFVRYVTARDRGLVVFDSEGYVPADGDTWQEQPELLIDADAAVQDSLETVLREFEVREGVRLDARFMDSAQLEAELQTLSQANTTDAKLPDVWIAGDQTTVQEASPHKQLAERLRQYLLDAKVPYHETDRHSVNEPQGESE